VVGFGEAFGREKVQYILFTVEYLNSLSATITWRNEVHKLGMPKAISLSGAFQLPHHPIC
jgi:hypothetical protein